MTILKIGIYGSNVTESEQAVQLARRLGEELSRHNLILVTGGCSGMPYLVARAAREGGAEVWGFTPARDEQEQKRLYPSDEISTYTRLFFVPPQYMEHFALEQPLSPAQDYQVRLKYRNLISTTHVDAGIILAGGWGTMNELTSLFYEGKPVAVLLGTGGLADLLPEWYGQLRKKSERAVLFSADPQTLLARLLEQIGEVLQ